MPFSNNIVINDENVKATEKQIITEREPVYAGIISAGSGSVSSTKIKNEIEGKRKKFKKIQYLNKAPASNSHKTNMSQYQRKYKFTPTTVIGSGRSSAQSKPPLGTINSVIGPSGASGYKHNRPSAEGLDSARGYSSTASYQSTDSKDQEKPDSNIRSFITDSKKSVAAKLSATLPKSSGYRKATASSSYKSQINNEKPISGQKFKIYANSSRDSKKKSYNSSINYPSSTKNYSGSKTGKYARIPNSIPKNSLISKTVTDGSAVQVRTFECSASPFRTNLSESGSAKRTSYLSYKKSSNSEVNSSL